MWTRDWFRNRLEWVVSRQSEKSYLESVPSSVVGQDLPFPETENPACARSLNECYRPNSEVQNTKKRPEGRRLYALYWSNPTPLLLASRVVSAAFL